MKKVILSAFALIACASASYAQTAATAPAAQPTATAAPAQQAAAQATAQADGNTKIEAASLPAAVKTSLAGADYKDWSVSNAWQAKDGSYVIELKKADATTTVKMDKDGKKIG
ncbi:MAG: hypothetical protein ACTHJ0_05220 [Flavipsychrobacter sp.]